MEDYPKMSLESFGGVYALQMVGSRQQIQNQFYSIINHSQFIGKLTILSETAKDFCESFVWIKKSILTNALAGQKLAQIAQEEDRRRGVPLCDTDISPIWEVQSKEFAKERVKELLEEKSLFKLDFGPTVINDYPLQDWGSIDNNRKTFEQINNLCY